MCDGPMSPVDESARRAVGELHAVHLLDRRGATAGVLPFRRIAVLGATPTTPDSSRAKPLMWSLGRTIPVRSLRLA